MSGFGWKTRRAKRSREASVKEQEALLDDLVEEGESDLHIYREVDPGFHDVQQVYPFRFGGDPFPYYRFSPYFFGGQPTNTPSTGNVQSQKTVKANTKASTKSAASKATQKKLPNRTNPQAVQDGSQPAGYGYYPYPYPYPYAYSYPQQPYTPQQSHAQPSPSQPYAAQPYPSQPYAAQPYPAQPYPAQPYPYPYLNQSPPSEMSEDDESTIETMKSGMMSINGRRPLFLVALFVVSIAVLLVSFPLTLLSAGYIGPLGLMFAMGPFATIFAFWAIYLTPCECYPNIDWAVSRIRVFSTAAAVFDAVGTIGVPISMYGAQCPDDDDTMLGCEDELPAAKGISMAVSVVLGTHLFLCILVRSNARKLAESKYGDERTEGITLTPTPFRR